MSDKEGELYQSVKLASLDLVGSNPTSFTSEKKVKIVKENAWLNTDNRRILRCMGNDKNKGKTKWD